MFDAASRYLLFPLKRVVADALLPHLEMVSPAELCHWLVLSDMYVLSVFFSHIPSLYTNMPKLYSHSFASVYQHLGNFLISLVMDYHHLLISLFGCLNLKLKFLCVSLTLCE